MDPRTRLREVAATWHPPGELERSRPRELRLRPAGVVLVVISALMAASSIGVGVLLHLKASADHEARRQLMDYGQNTAGQVVQRFTARSGDHSRYVAVYEYRVDGRVHAGSVDVGRRAWQALVEGARVTVRYLPSDPGRHIVAGHAGGLMPLWVPYLVAAGLALGAWLVTRPVASQRLLLAEGRPAPGIVTSHDRESKHGVVAHFMFRLLSGSTAEGRTGAQKKPPELGSLVCVLYLPDRKNRYAVYPLSLVATAHGPRATRAKSARHA